MFTCRRLRIPHSDRCGYILIEIIVIQIKLFNLSGIYLSLNYEEFIPATICVRTKLFTY